MPSIPQCDGCSSTTIQSAEILTTNLILADRRTPRSADDKLPGAGPTNDPGQGSPEQTEYTKLIEAIDAYEEERQNPGPKGLVIFGRLGSALPDARLLQRRPWRSGTPAR